MQAVILAGGLGTRLGSLTNNVPKPMIPVNGKPFLEHEINLLKENGITEYVFCVGYLGEMIQSHFGNGEKFGVNIQYNFDGPKLLGPAGALKQAESMLHGSFFVTYGDAYLRANYHDIMECLLRSDKLALMAVYQNDNKFAKSDLAVKDGLVTKYDKKNQSKEMTWINFGVSAMKKDALQFIPSGRECGEEEFYGELIKRNQLIAYPVVNRFYEIGNPDSLKEFEQFMTRV
ncbi:MAG: sugar phosphate nucleotidyltransferase [Nitrososphaerales archaeon]